MIRLAVHHRPPTEAPAPELYVTAAKVRAMAFQILRDGGTLDRMRLFVPRGTTLLGDDGIERDAETVEVFDEFPVVVTKQPIVKPYLIPHLSPHEITSVEERGLTGGLFDEDWEPRVPQDNAEARNPPGRKRRREARAKEPRPAPAPKAPRKRLTRKEWNAQRFAEGICRDCPDPREGTSSWCAPCRKKRYASMQRWRQTRRAVTPPKAEVSPRQMLRRERIAAGFCRDCGNPRDGESATRCSGCHGDALAKARRRYAEKKGTVPEAPKPPRPPKPPREPKVGGATISKTPGIPRKDRVALGLCHDCGKERDGASRWRCQACHEENRASHARVREQMKRAGICYECRKRPNNGTLRCDECARRNSERTCARDKRIREEVAMERETAA